MISKREVAIIAGVEIAAGVVESLIIPNLGKKGEKFVWPNKMNLVSSAVALSATGIASGFTADYIMQRFNLTADKRMKRVAVITGVAIAFNILEATFIDNVVQHHAAIENWKLPTLKKFSQNLSVLALAGLAVGFLSDQLIAATAPSLEQVASSNVLVDKKELAELPQ